MTHDLMDTSTQFGSSVCELLLSKLCPHALQLATGTYTHRELTEEAVGGGRKLM